jgi:hypothetical protein
VCPWFRLQVLRDHRQAVFRAEYDVDVVADARTGHCVVPSGLIYLNLMQPGTPVPGYRLFRPRSTSSGQALRDSHVARVKSGDMISIPLCLNLRSRDTWARACNAYAGTALTVTALTPGRDRHHRVLACDPAQLSMQSIPHLFPDCRLSSAGAERQVNQARYVTMRHENQPSLTGLVFLAHWTQHWFGAGPLFSSCTACVRRTVLGYYQVVPAGLCATNSCDSSRTGEECTSYRTV